MDISAGYDDESMDGADGDDSEGSDEDADANVANSQPEDDTVCSKCYSNWHGVKVHNSGTGGKLGGKVVKAKGKKKKCGMSNRNALGKMKIIVPVIDEMDLRLHMRMLMNSHVALAAYHTGEPVYVCKGTKVLKLS